MNTVSEKFISRACRCICSERNLPALGVFDYFDRLPELRIPR